MRERPAATRVGRRVALVALLGATLAAGLGLAAAGGGPPSERKRERQARRRAASAAVFGVPERFTDIGTREPSGVVYHPGLRHLFVVGDEGTLVELDKTPAVVRTDHVKGNLEDITLHPPSGLLLILAEAKSELIGYDPVARARTRRWHLDSPSLLADEDASGERSHGFEGLGFRARPGLPGGGLFYLARQRAPSAIVAFAFDPQAAPAGLLGPQVVSRWPMTVKNLKSVSFVPALERFLVLSNNGLTVVTADGVAEETLAVGGDQPEGVCLDDDGTMWIADDRGQALLKFPRALAVLEQRLGR